MNIKFREYYTLRELLRCMFQLNKLGYKFYRINAEPGYIGTHGCRLWQDGISLKSSQTDFGLAGNMVCLRHVKCYWHESEYFVGDVVPYGVAEDEVEEIPLIEAVCFAIDSYTLN